MDRVYQANAVETPPEPVAPSGSYPTAGSKTTGQVATIPGPYWFYSVTEELRNALIGVGLTPDPNKVNQLAEAFAKFLPSGGGMLTGTISYTGDVFAKKTTNNSYLVIQGGSNWDYGSYLQLIGSESSNNPSGFLIQSRLNGNSVSFEGTNSGSLKWNGKEIERVSSTGTGYIRYESGLQICFGDVSPTSSGVQVTYGAPFKDPWARILISTTAGNGDAPATQTAHYIGSANKTATGFKAYSNLNIYADWFAIGWYK